VSVSKMYLVCNNRYLRSRWLIFRSLLGI